MLNLLVQNAPAVADAAPGVTRAIAAVGGGLAAIGAGIGIGLIGGLAGLAIARQPEAAAEIKGNALLFAVLVEGVAIIAVVVAILFWLNDKG